MPELAKVRRAAASRQRADEAYRSAILAAVHVLEQAGARDPYAQVAAAAGISKQAVRQLVARSRN